VRQVPDLPTPVLERIQPKAAANSFVFEEKR